MSFRSLAFALPLAAALVTGCADSSSDSPDVAPVDTPAVSTSADGSDCPDDGPRLTGTQLCAGRAVSYLNVVEGDEPTLPDGCEWVVNETEMPMGDYLLYRAARCNGQTAHLAFAGGAHMAELTLDPSVVGGEAVAMDVPMVRIVSSDPEAPEANILAYVNEDLEASGSDEDCSVRPANVPGWPADALVADVSPEVAAESADDGPRAACGTYGFSEDETSYWRVFQGWTWFFQLGQDLYQDIDPRSLTLLTPDGSGGWTPVE